MLENELVVVKIQTLLCREFLKVVCVELSCINPQQSQRTGPRLWATAAQQRWASSLPMNTVVLFVPQQEAWVVERMGRFHRILEPVPVRLLSSRGRCCGVLTGVFV